MQLMIRSRRSVSGIAMRAAVDSHQVEFIAGVDYRMDSGTPWKVFSAEWTIRTIRHFIEISI